MRVALLADPTWETTARLLEIFAGSGHAPVLDPPWAELDGFDLAVLRGSYWEEPRRDLMAKAERLHAAGTPFFNGFHELRRADDKLTAGRLFAAAGLRVPATWSAVPHEPIPLTAERLIVKPRWGAQQRGVEVFATAAAAQHHLRRGEDGPYLVQEFVVGRYWRVIATSTRAIRCYDLPSDERGVTRLPAGAARVVVEAYGAELARTAVRAVRAVGGSLMGVDLIEDGFGRLWILEVNNAFGFNIGDVDVEQAFLEVAGADATQADQGCHRLTVPSRMSP